MSYCVNCGVELQEKEKSCILCGCDVVNPMEKPNPDAVRAYPDNIDEMTQKSNRRFSVMILSCLFALPALICFSLNIIYFNTVLWSVYVIGGFAFLWVCIVVPLINRHINLIVILFFDFLAAALYLFVIEKMLSVGQWFLAIALPILIFLWILTEIMVVLTQKNRIGGFQVPGLGFGFIGLLTVGIDVVLHLYANNGIMISWSAFVMIPSFLLAVLFFFIEKKQTIKEELLKRLHF
jgi:hypothetical protein